MFWTDDYLDETGKKWFCVADPKKWQMVCKSYDDGYFTCASFNTFERWGWKRVESITTDVSGAGERNNG